VTGFGFKQEDVKRVCTFRVWLVERISVVTASTKVSLDTLRLGPWVRRGAGYT
jgi:hypothetical protein